MSGAGNSQWPSLAPPNPADNDILLASSMPAMISDASAAEKLDASKSADPNPSGAILCRILRSVAGGGFSRINALAARIQACQGPPRSAPGAAAIAGEPW